MKSTDLQKHLEETWMRDQSADDAYAAIWGEPFDGYTVPIAERERLERENARLREALKRIRDEDHEYRDSEWRIANEALILPNPQAEPRA